MMSLIKGLKNAALYGHPVNQFEVIETHISWVLLTGQYVYKLKKPVNFGFLDFSTLEKRRFYCEEELRLNQRLAPQLYLEVVAITGSEAQPELNGQGPVIEYAVKMRQFPQSSQLDHLLQESGLDTAIIDKLADKVAQFHLTNRPVEQGGVYGDVDHISQPVLENFAQVRAYIQDPLITQRLDKLEQWSQHQLAALTPIMELRKVQGFIRECHGDMHLRNIALWQDEIILFDCIEFNENFYWIDVMSEIAFLVMDLEDRQQGELAQHFLNRYLEITGDYSGLKVFLFYKVYRAMVRVKVAALRCTQEESASDAFSQTWLELQQYIKLAEEYVRPVTPCLIINFGLSGSGKSVGARLFSEKLSAIQLRSDVERKRLFNVPFNEEVDAKKEAMIYSSQSTQLTYNHLLDIARDLLKDNYSVIIDAANLKQWQRRLFTELARTVKVKHVIVAYHADEMILKQRLVERARRNDDVSDASPEVLQKQLQNYEPLTDEEELITIKIDTGKPVNIDAIITTHLSSVTL